MEKIELEVVNRDGHWYVQVRQRFKNQAAALNLAESMGRRLGRTGIVETFLRRLNGTIGPRNTYPRKSDPPESKG